MKKTLIAVIREKGKNYRITRIDSDYATKKDYAEDCRRNGYYVTCILTIKEAQKIQNFSKNHLNYSITEIDSMLKKYSDETIALIEDLDLSELQEQKAEEQAAEETLKININYSKISNGWTIEYFLKEHGFKKTAEALWVQCYYNAEKDVEVNTFFEERKPETPETEWKAEVLEAIAEQQAEEEQPTEEQPTAEQKTEEPEQATEQQAEEQAADNQTTEQEEDTAEQQTEEEQAEEEQQQLRPRKPKKYHELIEMIIKAEESDLFEIFCEIDFAYQHDKIEPRENDQLYSLINKIF